MWTTEIQLQVQLQVQIEKLAFFKNQYELVFFTSGGITGIFLPL